MPFSLSPPEGFQGLLTHKPVNVSKRNLPHWRQAGATYFVTFRLADALPASKLQQLSIMRAELRNLDGTALAEFWKKEFQQIERWMDEGLGSCCLAEAATRHLLVKHIQRGHDEDYELGAWVVMPNHVHLIIRPLEDHEEALSKTIQRWKRSSALSINARLKRTGPLWQSEYYDRIVRDAEHLWNTLQYIGNNPEKAKLANGQFERWVNPHWEQLGWTFTA